MITIALVFIGSFALSCIFGVIIGMLSDGDGSATRDVAVSALRVGIRGSLHVMSSDADRTVGRDGTPVGNTGDGLTKQRRESQVNSESQ